MTGIDYGILAVILVSLLLGFWRGFVKEISALCVWGIAIWIGWCFNRKVSVFLPAEIDNPSIRAVIAYSLLIATILFLGCVVGYFLSTLVEEAGLTGIDRFAGLLLGIARGITMTCVLIMIVDLTPVSEQIAWQQSSLIPSFQALALWVREQIQPGKADYNH